MVYNGKVEELIASTPFVVKGLNNQTLLAKDQPALDAFRASVAELNRKVSGSEKRYDELNTELELIEKAVLNYPNTDLLLFTEIRELKLLKAQLREQLYGDDIKTRHEFETAPTFTSRLGMIDYQLSENTTGVSATHKANFQMVEQEYAQFKVILATYQTRVLKLHEALDKANIPYTRSRLDWKKD